MADPRDIYKDQDLRGGKPWPPPKGPSSGHPQDVEVVDLRERERVEKMREEDRARRNQDEREEPSSRFDDADTLGADRPDPHDYPDRQSYLQALAERAMGGIHGLVESTPQGAALYKTLDAIGAELPGRNK